MTKEVLNWIEEMKNAMEQDYSCRDINDVKVSEFLLFWINVRWDIYFKHDI